MARTLLGKNPIVLRQAKVAFKQIGPHDWDSADDYLMAKQEQGRFQDTERGREQGLRQFLDKKSFKPGLGADRREG